MERNGRNARIWIGLILRKNLAFCVDWSKINKRDLVAMQKAPDGSAIQRSIADAFTDVINDHEVFIKLIDYSYFYSRRNNELFREIAPNNNIDAYIFNTFI